MSYAQILVVLSGAPDDESTVRIAASLAKQHGAVARVLVASPRVNPAVWSELGNGLYYSQEVRDAIAAGEAEMQRKSEALVRQAAAAGGLAFGPGEDGCRFVMTTSEATLWLGLRKELPLIDLVIVGQSSVREDGPFAGVLDSALMDGRAPLLVVRGGGPIDRRPAAVAWDGSIEAGRAVRAAAPLLQLADSVVILQDPERLDDSERGHAAPEALSAYFKLRGIGPVTNKPVMSTGPGEGLKQVATDMGAAVLVAGAFGHPRLLETVFGGATQALLADEQGPHLFIAH
ncbi:MAG TPA: universal stress protein [Caulobacteraceae bacterium]